MTRFGAVALTSARRRSKPISSAQLGIRECRSCSGRESPPFHKRASFPGQPDSGKFPEVHYGCGITRISLRFEPRGLFFDKSVAATRVKRMLRSQRLGFVLGACNEVIRFN